MRHPIAKASAVAMASVLLMAPAACSRNTQDPDPAAAKAKPEAEHAPTKPPAMPPGHPPTGSTGASTPTQEPKELGPEQAGGLTFHAEAPLERRPPGSSMRAAEYVLADAPDAPLTVFHFPQMGGGIEANVTRWVGQFTQPDGKSSKDAAEVEKREVNGIVVTHVELQGTYGGGMAAPRGKAPQKIDHAMLFGAIAEGPKGPVFFKWVGPADLLQAHESAFDALITSISPQD